MELLPGERLDDLQYKGLRLLQRPDAYCFTSDAVLLANLVKAGARDKVADLGAGGGIISVLIAAKRGADVMAVEFQPWAAQLCRRNALLNGLQEKISVFQGDIKGCAAALGAGAFDAVVSNPPYFKAGSGEVREEESVALSRHESTATLADICAEAAALLKNGGAFYMVHKVERMAEALTALSLHGLQPKAVTLILPKPGKGADTFVVRAVKGGRAGMKLDMLTVYEKNGEMTKEAARLYGKA